MLGRVLAWPLALLILASLVLPAVLVFAEVPRRCESALLVMRCGPGDPVLKLLYALAPMTVALALCKVGCVGMGLATFVRPAEKLRAWLTACAECTVVFGVLVFVARYAVTPPFERPFLLTSRMVLGEAVASVVLLVVTVRAARPGGTARAWRIGAALSVLAALYLCWNIRRWRPVAGFAVEADSLRWLLYLLGASIAALALALVSLRARLLHAALRLAKLEAALH